MTVISGYRIAYKEGFMMVKYVYKKYKIYSYSNKQVTTMNYSSYWPGNDYPDCKVYSSQIIMQYTDQTDATNYTLLDAKTGLYPDSSYYYTTTTTCKGYGSYRHLIICTPALAYYVRGCKTTPTHTSLSGGRYQCLYKITATATKGSLVCTVIANDGAYPDDGLASDGYWYIKDHIAVEFKVRVNGAWVSAEPYVRVNGVWKATMVYPRVNGSWVG